MICPRRSESVMQFSEPGSEQWELRGKYRCCSFCGSMHPDDVISAIKELGSGIIEGTTKSYKRYIRLPGVTNATEGPIKFYTMHFSNGQIDEYNNVIKNEMDKP